MLKTRPSPHLSMSIHVALLDHPGKQIDLGNNRDSSWLAIDPLGDNCRTVPLKELIEIAQAGVLRNLNELAS
jgi:hypothetical protein